MRKIEYAIIAAILLVSAHPSHSLASDNQSSALIETVVDHSGGCRKASPPGLC